jgi:HlyD family secretion protein
MRTFFLIKDATFFEILPEKGCIMRRGIGVFLALQMRWFVILFLALVTAGSGLYLWQALQRPPPLPPDRLTETRKGTIVRGVVAVGRVEPRTRIELKSRANGIIRKLYVDVAEPIHAGQVLVELDREILQARVTETEGKVQGARGALESARAEAKRIEVEKSDPEIAYATRNWERAKKLHAAGLVSDDDLDQARDRFEKAEYRVRLLDAGLEKAKAVLASANGGLKEVEAQAELARQELQEATIVSAIDGVVLHRYLEEGDSVSSIRVAGGNATTIMTLGDLSELYVDGEVDEVDVGKIISQQKIKPDLIAKVNVESLKGRTFLGKVARIAPLGLEDSNGIVTFEVRIILENPEKLLLANMTANSQIILEEKRDVLLLSQGALITDGKARYAIVYDPETGSSQRKEIVAGISDGSQVEIAGGLELGQKIVIP